MKKALLSVLESPIHGYGVFTRQALKRGQFIAELRGSRVYYEPTIYGQSNRYGDWIGIGKNTWIDPIDEFQYLNHSCAPTAGLKGSRKLRLYALRDIAAGEEITIDYSTTEEDVDYCFETEEPESPAFRKFIGPIQTLPEKTYREYLPFIPKYFQKVYEREVLSKHEGN
ncbi:MAG TPA: SET domain-containing protein-lysine N-methyltransferase [Candidatus Paceibacterota bacterium]